MKRILTSAGLALWFSALAGLHGHLWTLFLSEDWHWGYFGIVSAASAVVVAMLAFLIHAWRDDWRENWLKRQLSNMIGQKDFWRTRFEKENGRSAHWYKAWSTELDKRREADSCAADNILEAARASSDARYWRMRALHNERIVCQYEPEYVYRHTPEHIDER